jgi:uncharacterized protein (TIGR00645 family)
MGTVEATETNTETSEEETESDNKSYSEIWLDNHFEPKFFQLRYAILFPVVVSFFGSLVMFTLGTYHISVATISLIADQQVASTEVTLPIIRGIDAFLVGIILIIFSFGIYDFFISELEPVEHAGVRPDWFKFETTGELKNKLIEIVLVILSIKFFEQMVAHTKDIESIEMYLIIPVGAAILAISLGYFKSAIH